MRGCTINLSRVRYCYNMKRLTSYILFCALAAASVAQDFSLTVGSGQTLYFNLVAGGVEVTYPNHTGLAVNGWDGYTRPTGDLQIPSSVSYGGAVYSVLRVGQLAFYGCTGLSSVAVGNGITWLGNSAFNGCSGISTVVVPSSVDTVGLRVFEGCTGLSDVWCNSVAPPRTSPYAFYNLALDSRTLHVPSGSQAAYASAAPWSSFGSIEADGPWVSLMLTVNDPLRGSVVGGGEYDVGTSVTFSALPAPGFAFICWSDGDERNPRTVMLTADLSLCAMFFAPVHDTVEVVDTMVVEVHDTVVVRDTADLVFAQLRVRSSDDDLGAGVGTAEVPVGTSIEVCALSFGGRFAGWSDGSHDNPRRVTVAGDMTLTAFFEQLANPDAEQPRWHLHTEGRTLVVVGANDLEISVYDAVGRWVSACRTADGEARIALPAAGVYAVKVGDWGGKKVCVE